MATTQTEAQNPQAKPAEEKQTNCLGCGKPIKKIKKYYRNGKFYCTKKCWQNAKEKAKKSEEPAK